MDSVRTAALTALFGVLAFSALEFLKNEVIRARRRRRMRSREREHQTDGHRRRTKGLTTDDTGFLDDFQLEELEEREEKELEEAEKEREEHEKSGWHRPKGLTSEMLPVGNTPMSDAHINNALSVLVSHLKLRSSHHLGYPYNLRFASHGLVPFMNFSINNLGDPFRPSNYGVNSHDFELAVLDFFARVWSIKAGDYWGYITTCGTEGNLLGLLYGREKFLPARDGVLFCSRESHYSVPKAAAMYRMELELVETDVRGEMVYADLEARLKKHSNRPVIVNVNAGTTVKGASDQIDSVVAVLRKCGIPRERFYIHVDAALSGMIVPFLSGVNEAHRISFQKPIDSCSVSGHKMLGCPMPCGVVITRAEHMRRWASDVEYLNSTDTTIMGSRNGQAALAMWVALQRKGLDGLREDVVQCIDNARYLKDLLDKSQIRNLLNDFSTTVVFERPPEDVVLKWQLACSGDTAHVVVMPSVSKAKLRRFHFEVVAARARDGVVTGRPHSLDRMGGVAVHATFSSSGGN
uniref:Histidine decarboxylase n=1 Tax=Chromera velia CCMP2878 TaxID=1169474 RepID=A0A0G4H5E8_9ALVE|eukprot:Cvel_24748.t1-p1 / transcript=Cvel_24748.t1 / gene=Cvel_24748 / organism=Chromera_velia_CCMP2878 / gene_product=Histidine decarboxylase, putative / transcript_product=Histidine decarboxylase, putative / location=Cvel_scaffold2719:622-2712(-) / protein_length=520 / sequence_SO=supercontig / SO=protein_coding / is_pseudo=false